jgi:hypothetical protein
MVLVVVVVVVVNCDVVSESAFPSEYFEEGKEADDVESNRFFDKKFPVF